MQYKIYARGKTGDYKWSSAPDFEYQEYLNGNGIIVKKTDAGAGNFAVYLVSELSTATDSQGRRTRIGVLATECSESEAKGIAVWALKNWGDFCSEFKRLVKGFGSDAWEADADALKILFEGIISEVGTTYANAEELDQRWENGNNRKSRDDLADEIKKYNFSKPAGFKLAVDGGLMTGGKLQELKEQVQRYLAGDRNSQDPLPDPNLDPPVVVLKKIGITIIKKGVKFSNEVVKGVKIVARNPKKAAKLLILILAVCNISSCIKISKLKNNCLRLDNENKEFVSQSGVLKKQLMEKENYTETLKDENQSLVNEKKELASKIDELVSENGELKKQLMEIKNDTAE